MKNCNSTNTQPKIGVSSCLLGNQVRFDGGHKNSPFISQVLSQYVQLHVVCPEQEAGFGTPRAAMQLRLKDKQIRLLVSRDKNNDVTQKMQQYAHNKVHDLADLDGFIFKKNSPSCGLFRVPLVINEQGYRSKEGIGLFAQAFCKHYPLIPVEEEGRLQDKLLRENFFERVYAYQRWRAIPDAEHNVKDFYQFHAQHKLLLMARGSHYYQQLGQLVAGTNKNNLLQRRDEYIQRFMFVMSMTSKRGRQVNVLLHIMGYFKKFLNTEDKQELLAVFEAYRQNHIPLVTPITLLRHYLRIYPQAYLSQQFYLQPFPEQLALRSFL